MNSYAVIIMLVISNIFMTFAWYGHLKLEEMKIISNMPLYGVILMSWLLAIFEYNARLLPLLDNKYKSLIIKY